MYLKRFAAKLALLAMMCVALFPECRAQSVQVIEDSADNKAIKVLFIGNSFTFFNNLPGMVAALIKNDRSGRPAKIYCAAYPNYTLEEHLSDERTMRALEKQGPWDFVILQERSHYPVYCAVQMQASCRKLDKKIKACGARTVLLETWADLDALQSQSTISRTCGKIAAELGAPVVPAGQVWLNAMKTARLYADDGHHPSPEGSYLVACTIYKTLTGNDPPGLPVDRQAGIAPGSERQIRECVSRSLSGRAGNVHATSGGATAGTADRAPASNKGVQGYRW